MCFCKIFREFLIISRLFGCFPVKFYQHSKNYSKNSKNDVCVAYISEFGILYTVLILFFHLSVCYYLIQSSVNYFNSLTDLFYFLNLIIRSLVLCFGYFSLIFKVKKQLKIVNRCLKIQANIVCEINEETSSEILLYFIIFITCVFIFSNVLTGNSDSFTSNISDMFYSILIKRSNRKLDGKNQKLYHIESESILFKNETASY